MKQQRKGIARFFLAFVIILGTVDCRSENNEKGICDNNIPLCADAQNLDKNFFEKIESVEDNIRNTLRRLHEFDILQQKMGSDCTKKTYIDYFSYVKARKDFLASLNAELLKKGEKQTSSLMLELNSRNIIRV